MHLKGKFKIIPRRKNYDESVIVPKKRYNLLTSIVLILLLLAAVLIVYYRTNPDAFDFLNKKDEVKNVIAVVNGKEITMQELDARYERLPPNIKISVDKNRYLDQLIDEELLVQESEKRGYTVSDDEISNALVELSLQAGVPAEELESILASQNISLDELRIIYRREKLITKLINDTVVDQVKVGEAEISEYYDANIEEFSAPEAIKVNHLIICHNESVRCQSNRTKEEAESLIQVIYDKVNDTNFEDLARQYSEEPNAMVSAGALEGQVVPGYVTKEDPFDPTFLEAAFELDAGEHSRPVETVFGFHLIKVSERIEAGPLPLVQVRDYVNQTVKFNMEMELFTDLLNKTREKAVITRFS
jgi:peptidyl-prolyl cis-trans isomerase SurA